MRHPPAGTSAAGETSCPLIGCKCSPLMGIWRTMSLRFGPIALNKIAPKSEKWINRSYLVDTGKFRPGRYVDTTQRQA